MPMNKVQFQRGMSMADFLAAYGTDRQCRDALVQARWPNGFECPDCGSKHHCLLSRGRFQCQVCRKQTSPTAGTIFQDTKLPLATWFLAMHLLTQGKHGVSALELKRQLGVCYESAWNLKQKLMQVMLEREALTVLSGRVEVDDAYMGGERHEGKRGRGAGGKTPFVVGVQTDPENPAKVLRVKMAALKHVGAKDLRPWFARYVAKGRFSKILTDGWKAYNFLKGEGFDHEPTPMPGGWRSAKHPKFKWVNTVLGNLKGNVTGVTRWIGKAHLDRYLAEFCWRFNRRFDLAALLPRLLTAAAKTQAMPQPLLKITWAKRAA